MTIDCPKEPGFSAFQPLIVQRSAVLETYAGSEIQRINRLGDRFGAVVTLPIMSEARAADWCAWWLAGQSELVAIPWLVRPAYPRGYGAPLVNGANQAGRSLVADGFAPYARIEAGHVFSILSAGRRQVCVVTARTQVNASGQATLPIWPALRFAPADNATLEFDKPILQGFLLPEESPWTPRMAGLVEMRFAIREA